MNAIALRDQFEVRAYDRVPRNIGWIVSPACLISLIVK